VAAVRVDAGAQCSAVLANQSAVTPGHPRASRTDKVRFSTSVLLQPYENTSRLIGRFVCFKPVSSTFHSTQFLMLWSSVTNLVLRNKNYFLRLLKIVDFVALILPTVSMPNQTFGLD